LDGARSCETISSDCALSAANVGISFQFQWNDHTQLLLGMEADALFAGMTILQLLTAVITGELMQVLVPFLVVGDRMDFDHYLAEEIPVKVHLASMTNYMEVRSPLLDYWVIEFAFGRIRANLKANASGYEIVLLARLAKRLLQQKLDFQRKQGCSIQLSKMLMEKRPFRDLLCDALTQLNCVLDQRKIQHLLRGPDKGVNHGERLFGLVLLKLWRRKY